MAFDDKALDREGELVGPLEAFFGGSLYLLVDVGLFL